MKKQRKPLIRVLSATTLVAVLAFQIFPFAMPASAAQIGTPRSLTLQAGTTDSDSNGIPDGGSMPSGVVNHQFDFPLPTAGQNLGSIKFEYCTTAAAVPSGIDCDAPVGLTTATASLGASSGAAVFNAVTNPSANVSIASRTAATFGGGAISLRLDGIQNPSATNTTFFVRISSYASTDGTGTAIDSGVVAASTANPIELSGTMPESLVFCTGRAISETNNVPDCTTATAGTVAFNQLFSPQSASWATSQMAASTNAGQGYAITVNGPTMTSGSNTITAIGAASATSQPGTSQFGMNVVLGAETNSAIPAPTPASASVTTPTGGSLYNGAAVAPYATGDATADGTNTAQYAFTTSNIVANSGGAASDSQVFTSTYLVNVPGSQPAGTYATTLTYICTPTF